MFTPTQRDQFDETGYLFVPGLVPQDLVRALRSDADAILAASPDRRAWNELACFRRASFRRLLENERLIGGVRDLLGDDMQLLALDLRAVRPGEGRIDWHRDTNFVCDQTLAVNCAIYLQDTDTRLGPLQVAPRTHRSKEVPEGNDLALQETAALSGPAGSVVFHDAATWHTASLNRSAEDCWMAFPFFGRFWIKRMDRYFTQALPASLTRHRDPLIRQLVGVELQPGVRSFLGDSPEYNLRGEAGIDFEIQY